MSVRNSACPKCASALDAVKDVRWNGPFLCPNCHKELRVSTVYKAVHIVISVAAAFAICSSLHLRGAGFGVAFVVLLIPCMVSLGMLLKLVSTPKIVACEDDSSPFSSAGGAPLVR